ncbi:MAG: WD40 repeat domain-containing protein [Anaerolineae bacterium]|nr:WD40 repeat domain-containing protein [Anaerolineae bacterium]MDW8173500.1 WD40 repeat domain-containing protein [Anaerolineae bacterium]
MRHHSAYLLFCLLLALFAPLAIAQDDSIPRNAAIAAAQAVLGRRPNSWTYTIGQSTNLETLGCPLVGGLTLDRQVIPYRYELSYNDGIYVVYVSADGQIVVLCDQKFFTPATARPTVPPVAAPTATPLVVPVPATTPNVAVPPTIEIGRVLREYACPPDFVGYMPPRIRPGRATAAVEQGGVPNRLRPLPIADNRLAPQVGQAQPGRTLDFVLNGPACSGGFVWWYVEIDGVRGWTAESSADRREYFLVPTSGNEATFAPGAGAQAAPPELVRVDSAFRFATFMAFRGDAQAFFVYAYASGGAQQGSGTLLEYSVSNAQQTGRLLSASVPIVDVRVSSLGDLIVASNDSSVAVYNPDDLTNNPNQTVRPTLLLPNSFSLLAGNRPFVVAPSGTTLVSVACLRPANFGRSCDQISLIVYNLGNGLAIAQFSLPADVAYINDIVFAPDGRSVYISNMQGVYIIDLATGREVGRFSNADDTFLMLGMAVNPADGSILTTKCKQADPVTNGCALGEVALWASNGTLRGLLDSSAGNPLIVRYSPDGQTFVVGDSSGNVTLYSADGRVLKAIDGASLVMDFRRGSVSIDDVVYSPDGSHILFSTSDRAVYLWRVQSIVG